jgi:hypothetical protein
VVPNLALTGQCQLIGELKDNAAADDLKFGDGFSARKSATTTAITAPFVLMDDSTLEGLMLGSMATAVTVAAGTGSSLAVRAEALTLCQRFFTGGGAQRDFPKGSKVADEAKTDVGFGAFVSKVQFETNRVIRAAWKAGLVDDRAIAATLRPILDASSFGTGQFSGALAAFIGGFQGYRVQLCNLTANTAAETFTYSLDVEVFDHFGVDDTDINRPGAVGTALGTAMASFFVLQHDRNTGGLNKRLNKYRPYRITLRTDVDPHTARAF